LARGSDPVDLSPLFNLFEKPEMKKTLIAMAALAVSGASFAQVTIFGAVDASYNYASGNTAAAGSQSKSSLGNSQLGSSKLGFMGLEDLGGGLKGKFWLEGGLANDSGAGKGTNTNNQAGATGTNGLTFQRRSYVGLVGGFGELKLGREYVNTFLGVQAATDPFGTNGPADSTQMALALGATKGVATITNASNMITYVTPSMGGFSATIQGFMGENVSGAATSDDGGGYSVTGSYGAGPLYVALGGQETKYNKTAALGVYTQQSLAASYNFGVAKVNYVYTKEGLAITAHDLKNESNAFGVVVPFGAFALKGAYIAATNNVAGKGDQKGEMFGLGVDYSLSKRTKVYGTYGGIKNSDGGALYGAGVIGALSANGSTDNYAIGVFHAF
jgi:predicted porin